MGSLIVLLLQILLLVILGSFLLRYYEWRGLPAEVRGETGERLAPWLTGTLAVLWEFVTSLSVLLLIPVGWFDRDPDHRMDSDDRPILFIPGLIETRSAFIVLKRYFQRRGHRGGLFTVNLGPLNATLPYLAGLIDDRVDEIRAQTGKDKVDLICHGVGGLAARMYVKGRGADKIHTLITIGSPHQGTRLSVLFSGRLGRDIAPDAAAIRELNEDIAHEIKTGPTYLNIYSTFDNTILPPTLAELPGAVNYRLEYIGHTALLFSPEVRTICGRALHGSSTQGAEFHAEYPDD